MTVQDAFETFVRSRLRKGCLDKTIDSYKNLTQPLISFLGSSFEMEAVTQTHIEDFIDALFARKKLSRGALASYVRNAKIFLSWYQRELPGASVSYDASLIHIPRTPKKILRLYSPEEVQLIFSSVDASPEWLILRNQAMISLMLDSGLRQSEVAGLTVDNINFDNELLKVTGKGAKDRYVPLGHHSARLLGEYLSVRPFESSAVFLSVHGDPISCGAIKSMTADLQKQLPFEFSSHKLRHNFATNYLVHQYQLYGQMDVFQLMTIMGHEDISTTKRYLHEANAIIASTNCISHLDIIFGEQKKNPLPDSFLFMKHPGFEPGTT